MSAEDAEKEQKEWYKPKMTTFSEFVVEATKWIKGVTNKQSEIDADECNDDVIPVSVSHRQYFQHKKCSLTKINKIRPLL